MNWPSCSSHFGVIDLAGFPKSSNGYYRAWWRNDPYSLEVLPGNWNSPVPVGQSMVRAV